MARTDQHLPPDVFDDKAVAKQQPAVITCALLKKSTFDPDTFTRADLPPSKWEWIYKERDITRGLPASHFVKQDKLRSRAKGETGALDTSKRRDFRRGLTVEEELTHMDESAQEVMYAHRQFGRRCDSDDILEANRDDFRVLCPALLHDWDDDEADLAALEAAAWAWHDQEESVENERALLELMGAVEPGIPAHEDRFGKPIEAEPGAPAGRLIGHDEDGYPYSGRVDFPWHVQRVTV